MSTPPSIGTRDEWLAQRLRLLDREKAHTRISDELARERQQLPWVAITKDYRFATEAGERTLAELIDGRGQLIIYHFMFGPEWSEGCPSCSFLADHFDGALAHLNERDVTLMASSRAPLAALMAFKKRMGWKFPWASSLNSDFNFDFGVSFTEAQQATTGIYNFRRIGHPPEEMPGTSSFALHEGTVYHVYSSYARGGDVLTGTYQLLDRAPKGRDEDALPSTMAWVRRHDEYRRKDRT